MCASYIENSLQKKSDLFKETGLREGNSSLTIPKNPRLFRNPFEILSSLFKEGKVCFLHFS